MPDIVLTTLNARYIHASFGLRYVRSNLGDLFERSSIAEFDINQSPTEIVESLLAQNPEIVGLGDVTYGMRNHPVFSPAC